MLFLTRYFPVGSQGVLRFFPPAPLAPNATAQPLPEAGAQRALEAVGCNTPCPLGQSPRQKQGRLVIEYTLTKRS
jgi:hypothetical protein